MANEPAAAPAAKPASPVQAAEASVKADEAKAVSFFVAHPGFIALGAFVAGQVIALVFGV